MRHVLFAWMLLSAGLLAPSLALADKLVLVVGNEEAGSSFDVVLDSFADQKTGTIKVVRSSTGLGLKEAKDLVEAAPTLVKKGLSKEAAEKLRAELEAVGAKASVKSPAGASAPASAGHYEVILERADPAKQIDTLKALAATGLEMNQAKDLIEAAPISVKKGLTREAAEELRGRLAAVGAKIRVRSDEVVPGRPDAEPAPEESYQVVLESFAPDKKISTIVVVRAATGMGLKGAKDLVEAAPQLLEKGLTKEAAEKLCAQLEQAGAKGSIRSAIGEPVTARATSPATAPGRPILNLPFGVDFDRAGNLFLVELEGHRVMKLDAHGALTVIGGTGAKGNDGDGGPAFQAQFNGMHNLAVAPSGEIYLADTWNNRVRKLDPKTGVISAVAGTGKKGYSGDGGPAVEAQFSGVFCATLDPAGERLYLADLDNRRIRVVDLKSGKVNLIAGNGEKGIPKDGSVAVESPLVDPRAVAVDKQGNVYILERSGHALRVVDPTGKIRTVVGTGSKGATGDDGPALEATLSGPKHLCIDHDGSVLIADTDNHLIRRYLPAEGKIVRVAGTGKKGTAGVGGSPLEAQFNQPHGVTVHADGTLYITDSHNNRVLKIVK